MIYEKALFPELAYMFKHALTQDVAYNSLLEQRRQELHQLIGHAIEELYADRLAEQYGTLADHFSRGEAWPKALEYFCKAAARSTEAFATHEALALYEQASAVADRLSDRPLHTCIMIHRAQADLYMLVSDFPRARIAWEQVLTLARQLGDRRTEGIALVGMGQASFWGHQFEQALVDVRHASEIAQVADSQLVLAGAHLTTGLVYEVTGRLNEAENELAQALRLSRSAGDVTNEATTLVFMAEFKGWEGKFAEAVRLYTEAIGLARAHNVLMPLLEGLFMYGITLTGKGDYDEAHTIFMEGLRLAEKVGDANFSPHYLNSLGWLHIECGSLDQAIELNQRAAAGGHAQGNPESIANAELNLGDIFLPAGRFDPRSRVTRWHPSPRARRRHQRVDALAVLDASLRQLGGTLARLRRHQ